METEATGFDDITGRISQLGWSYGDSAYRCQQSGELVYTADAHREGSRCLAHGKTRTEAYCGLLDAIGKNGEYAGG